MASYYGGSTLSREQTAQVLYQAGFRGDALWQMTAIAERESGYNTGAHRTDSPQAALSGDRGLWQINYTWDQQLISAGVIRTKADLFDPLTNAKAAKFVFDRQGLDAWAMGGSGYQSGGDPFRNTNPAAARLAVQNAAARGLLGADYQHSGSPTGTAGGATGPTALPRDAILVRNDSATVALFNIGNGIYIHYALPLDGSVNLGGRTVQRISNQEYLRRYGRTVSGGHAEELKTIPTGYGTYANFWNSTIDSVIGKTNPARNDPDVLRVLAEYAGRPDMTSAELTNKLQATKWFQSRTEAELEYNSLGAMEKTKRDQETLARMKQAHFEFVGGTPNWTTKMPDVAAVASGRLSWNQWLETKLKPAALKNPESPWSRTVRDQQEAARQRGIDTENTSQRITDELERYGLRWDSKTLNKWAKDMVEKRKSDEDLTKALEQGAQALFPGLGPLNGQDVATIAAPWLETYERVLERKGSLFDPKIRAALAQGLPVWDMEKELTKTPEWLKTRNADERMHTFASQISEEFGF